MRSFAPVLPGGPVPATVPAHALDAAPCPGACIARTANLLPDRECHMLLLIDNYDSFTYNLVHYVGELGVETQVWRNDALNVQEAMALKPTGILLSPGPCDPDQAGICLDLTRAAAEANIPLLGVCLGHQAIGQAFG